MQLFGLDINHVHVNELYFLSIHVILTLPPLVGHLAGFESGYDCLQPRLSADHGTAAYGPLGVAANIRQLQLCVNAR